jgi:hypothetical protein
VRFAPPLRGSLALTHGYSILNSPWSRVRFAPPLRGSLALTHGYSPTGRPWDRAHRAAVGSRPLAAFGSAPLGILRVQSLCCFLIHICFLLKCNFFCAGRLERRRRSGCAKRTRDYGELRTEGFCLRQLPVVKGAFRPHGRPGLCDRPGPSQCIPIYMISVKLICFVWFAPTEL